MDEMKLKITNPMKHIHSTEKLSNYTLKDRTKLAGAAKDFESLLTGMMLKSMTDTNEGGLFGDNGLGGDMFGTIFNSELASHISDSSGLGIAEKIYSKITGEEWDPSLLNKARKVKMEGTFNLDGKIESKKENKVDIKNNKVEHITVPSKSSLNRLTKYEKVINQVAGNYGVDKNMIKSIILAESAANEKAISKADAKGLMQLIDSTAADMGVKNPFNPIENIHGGSKYFSSLLRQYDGDVERSLAAYNAGPGNVEKYNGVPPFEETRNYIARVLGYYNYFNG